MSFPDHLEQKKVFVSSNEKMRIISGHLDLFPLIGGSRFSPLGFAPFKYWHSIAAFDEIYVIDFSTYLLDQEGIVSHGKLLQAAPRGPAPFTDYFGSRRMHHKGGGRAVFQARPTRNPSKILIG